METRTPELTANFRLATEADLHLETYDNTKLTAVNTCPTWGIVRYQMHLRMPTAGRALALEAGSAMHEVFAFIRLVTLVEQWQKDRAGDADQVWQLQGYRLFGKDRFDAIAAELQATDDLPEMCKRGAVAILDTSGFYDDPRDKRRTLSNLEECSFAYINRWRWDSPVWVRDPTDVLSDVGIEIPFDIVCEITGTDAMTFRLTGKIDGIHWNTKNVLTLHENKTASRLNDAWAMSFAMSSQITIYCIAASVFTQHAVDTASIFGLAIPLPRSYEYGGYVQEPVSRQPYHYQRLITWLVHTIKMTRAYANNPYDAPKYTHSCNRYFRPCSLIPFCDADNEEQHATINEMEFDEWSPLHKEVLDGIGTE